MPTWIHDHLRDDQSLIEWLRVTEEREQAIERLIGTLADCLARGGRILTCGNGGSMCEAMHLAEELSGRFRQDRPAFPAQAISDPAHLTCVANDWGFDRVFARGVEAWGTSGDVLVLFSTSGDSPNIVAAAEAARTRGLVVVGLLGQAGGRVLALCDEAIVVPGRNSALIQEAHLIITHLLVEGVERRLVPDQYEAG